eukprot:7377028-Prymnesium_polylepis.1
MTVDRSKACASDAGRATRSSGHARRPRLLIAVPDSLIRDTRMRFRHMVLGTTWPGLLRMHPHRKVPGRISAQGELQQGDRAGDLCEAAAAGDTEHMAQLVGVGMGIDQGDYDKRSAP